MATKVAFVTGGAQGIGKAISGVLLKDGYKVAILDISETVGKQTADELSSQFGSGSCVFFKCDVTETEQLKGCYEQVRERYGNATVVVNNAGIIDETRWKKCVDINLKGFIDMTYLAVDNMRKDKGGKGGTIVNIASTAGLGPFPGYPTYSATKWGVIGFIQSMVASLSLAKDDWGISLLTLCPSFTDTALFRGAVGDGIDDMVISPSVPDKECKELTIDSVQKSDLISLEELSAAFETLLKDNKNGSFLRLTKDKDSPLCAKYVKHQCTEVEGLETPAKY